VLGVFRIHAASASASVERNCRAEMAVVEHHLARTNITSWWAVRRRAAISHYSAGRAHSKSRNFGDAWSHFRCAVLTWPLFQRTYAGVIVLLTTAISGWIKRRFHS
jgi:uncharacterized protein with PIN domain